MIVSKFPALLSPLINTCMHINRVHHAFSDCQEVVIVSRFENDLFCSALNRKNSASGWPVYDDWRYDFQ